MSAFTLYTKAQVDALLAAQGTTFSTSYARLPGTAKNGLTGWFHADGFGARGDGAAHPLSERFGSLGAAQAVYPFVTALTQSQDWAGIQAAANAALAANGTLFLPTPSAGTYIVNETISLAPPGSTLEFELQIKGQSQYTGITWTGGSNKAVVHAIGWKHSIIDSVNIDMTLAGLSNVIAWDLDTNTTVASTNTLTWQNCYVSMKATTGGVGWRLGHVSGGIADISFFSWQNCFVAATPGTANTRGWLNEGSNSLNHYWYGGVGAGLAKMFSNLSDTGATFPQGNDSMFFYGLGSSQNTIDFQFSAPGAYLISGGRFELGGRFLDVQDAANHAAVTVQGVNISDYTATSGQLVSFRRPGTLIWDGNYVNTQGSAYTAALFSLGGFTGLGSASFRGGAVRGADPFYTANGQWQVSVDGVGLLDSSTQTVARAAQVGSGVVGGSGGSADPTVFARYVNNGSSTTTARPTGSGMVIWVGSVTPANMVDGDIRISTS